MSKSWDHITKPTYVNGAASKQVGLINDDVRFLWANYEPNAKKELFKTFDKEICVGDILVVPATTRHGLTTVRVTDVDVDIDFDGPDIAHWVAARVDPESFLDLVKREESALQTIRSAELRQKRIAMREAIFANQSELLKTIDLAKVDKGLPSPETPTV